MKNKICSIYSYLEPNQRFRTRHAHLESSGESTDFCGTRVKFVPICMLLRWRKNTTRQISRSTDPPQRRLSTLSNAFVRAWNAPPSTNATSISRNSLQKAPCRTENCFQTHGQAWDRHFYRLYSKNIEMLKNSDPKIGSI